MAHPSGTEVRQLMMDQVAEKRRRGQGGTAKPAEAEAVPRGGKRPG